jgi:trehalose/maltose hydrolase-like predicted phosphorylase
VIASDKTGTLPKSEMTVQRVMTASGRNQCFALSNGHIGWRGNLDGGEPYGLPGSSLNGVFEIRLLPRMVLEVKTVVKRG